MVRYFAPGFREQFGWHLATHQQWALWRQWLDGTAGHECCADKWARHLYWRKLAPFTLEIATDFADLGRNSGARHG